LDGRDVGQFDFCKNFDFFVFTIELGDPHADLDLATTNLVCGQMRPPSYFWNRGPTHRKFLISLYYLINISLFFLQDVTFLGRPPRICG